MHKPGKGGEAFVGQGSTSPRIFMFSMRGGVQDKVRNRICTNVTPRKADISLQLGLALRPNCFCATARMTETTSLTSGSWIKSGLAYCPSIVEQEPAMLVMGRGLIPPISRQYSVVLEEDKVDGKVRLMVHSMNG